MKYVCTGGFLHCVLDRYYSPLDDKEILREEFVNYLCAWVCVCSLCIVKIYVWNVNLCVHAANVCVSGILSESVIALCFVISCVLYMQQGMQGVARHGALRATTFVELRDRSHKRKSVMNGF